GVPLVDLVRQALAVDRLDERLPNPLVLHVLVREIEAVVDDLRDGLVLRYGVPCLLERVDGVRWYPADQVDLTGLQRRDPALVVPDRLEDDLVQVGLRAPVVL